ncbi:hypothetical protein ID866_13196, partial [Astraeus odoratus]
MSARPEILWAQRSSGTDAAKNIIYLTVNLPDIDVGTLVYDLTSTSISFKATAGTTEKKVHEFSLNFFDEVIPEESTSRLNSRSFSTVLRKKTKKAEYWPRLTKEKAKLPYIKTDFSKWVDEDEQDGSAAFDDDMVGGIPGMDDGMGGMDFSQMMAQMGGG